MDYKEKYEKVLERARKSRLQLLSLGEEATEIEYIFPELTENDDEKIRKALWNMVNDTNGDVLWVDYDIHKEEALKWLAKQKPEQHLPDETVAYDKGFEEAQQYISERGFDVPWNDGDVFVDARHITQTVANVLAWGDEHPKQKDIVGIRPRFDIGNWIVYDYDKLHALALIVAIDHNMYKVELYNGIKCISHTDNIDYIDKNCHLWTLKDAKDGDILETVNTKLPFIYKGCLDTNHPDSPVAYCGVTTLGHLYVSLPEANKFWTSDGVQPATKAQQDRLINMMADKGYFFDFKDKEIKKRNPKIQQTEDKDTTKNIITVEFLNNNGFIFTNQECESPKCYSVIDKVDIELLMCGEGDRWKLTVKYVNNPSELTKVISTIKELQDCLNKMNINLKIKY